MAIVLVLAPLAATPSTVVLMAFAVIWAIVALSLVVLTGWGGNISLGQFAIVGAGAMAAGNVFERWNGDFIVATLVATVVGGLLALALGVPALRIRGLYLAVTTLAFAVALDSYFLNPVNFRGSVPERIVQPMLFKRFDTSDPTVLYYACLVCLVAVMAVLLSVRHRRSGLISLATRDNERSADALGVPTTRTKIQTFVLSGCIAGLAGSLYITVLGGVGLGTFQPTSSVNVFCYAVIGGLSSVAGAISGVALFRGIDFAVSKTVAGTAAAIIRLSLSGTGLLVVLYFLPGGLWQVVQRVRDRILGRLYERSDEEEQPSARTARRPAADHRRRRRPRGRGRGSRRVAHRGGDVSTTTETDARGRAASKRPTAGRRSSSASTSRSSRASWWPCSAPTGRASRPSSRRSPGCSRPRPAPSGSSRSCSTACPPRRSPHAASS